MRGNGLCNETIDGDGDGSSDGSSACDDEDPTRHPSADETCDGIDQDCDGDLLENFEDRDHDGVPTCLDSEERLFEVGPDGCLAPEGCGFGWDPRAAAVFLPLVLWRRRR